MRGHRMFCLVESFFRFCPERTLEEVDVGNLFKPPFRSRQLRRESLDGRFELLNLPDERRVVGFALLAELVLEHIGRKIINRLDLEHRRLTFESAYRRCQPLKPLLIRWRVWQDVTGISQRERPIFLELSPYAHPLAGLLRRQAENQQQPGDRSSMLCNSHYMPRLY